LLPDNKKLNQAFQAYVERAPAASNTYTRAGNTTAAKQAIESATKIVGAKNVRPYLVCDPDSKSVYLFGEMTILQAREIVEFYAIGLKSGHDYESLTQVYASPKDIREALEYVGFKPGHPVQPRKLHFWPKGERLKVDISGTRGGWSSLFDLVNNLEAVETPTNFVFTGSTFIPDRANTNQLVLGAEVNSPHAIIANYNEEYAIIDLPRQISKTTAYGKQELKADRERPTTQPILLRLRPYSDEPIEHAFRLYVTADPKDAAGLAYRLTDDADKAVLKEDGFRPIMQHLRALVESGKEPHLEPHFGPKVTISALGRFCAALEQLDSAQGVRIGAPPAGEAYYRSFNPSEQFRHRNARHTQPYELHLTTGELVEIKEVWKDGNSPELKVTTQKVDSPEAFRKGLDSLGFLRPTMFIYVPGDWTYDQLTPYTKVCRERFESMFVYKDDPPAK